MISNRQTDAEALFVIESLPSPSSYRCQYWVTSPFNQPVDGADPSGRGGGSVACGETLELDACSCNPSPGERGNCRRDNTLGGGAMKRETQEANKHSSKDPNWGSYWLKNVMKRWKVDGVISTFLRCLRQGRGRLITG
jgi:hypothetical protein